MILVRDLTNIVLGAKCLCQLGKTYQTNNKLFKVMFSSTSFSRMGRALSKKCDNSLGFYRAGLRIFAVQVRRNPRKGG